MFNNVCVDVGSLLFDNPCIFGGFRCTFVCMWECVCVGGGGGYFPVPRFTILDSLTFSELRIDN